MRVLMMGAPGSGKGTQAARLSKHLGIPAISSGTMLRDEMSRGTELGKQARAYVEKGDYVPDSVICSMVLQRVKQPDCAPGFILDGFPRTVNQAEIMEHYGIEIDFALFIEVADDIIVERLGGRRVCKKCDAVYHVVYTPPKREGFCDLCESELVIRADDSSETVKNRLCVFHELTDPVVGFYKDKVIRVKAALNPDDVTSALLQELSKGNNKA